jgi:hypothetical protein
VVSGGDQATDKFRELELHAADAADIVCDDRYVRHQPAEGIAICESQRVAGASAKPDVTLQVNVAPIDLPHADATLRHHLRRWGSQVAQVRYTLDLRKSPGPRGTDFEERRPAMEQLVEELAAASPAARVAAVDYREDAVRRVGEMFFAGVPPPAKDCYGAPFYGYFYGFAEVQTRYLLHMDCDMLFGGGSQTWIGEAIDLLRERPEVLFVAPLGGPPSVDVRIPRNVRRRQRHAQAFGSVPVLEAREPRCYRLAHVGSRIFFADLDRLRSAGPFSVLEAPPWSFGANLATTPFLPAESTLSEAMARGEWLRLDYLGHEPGMWTLHPGQRGPGFAANLPNVIAALEQNVVPEHQRGSSALRTQWLNALGPQRVEQPTRPLSARGIVKATARATGVVRLRNAVWREVWRRRQHLGRGEFRKAADRG